MRFFRCFGGSSSRKKLPLPSQAGVSAGSLQVNGKVDQLTGPVAPLLLESKLDGKVCTKEDQLYTKDVLTVADLKLGVDMQEALACRKADGLSSDTAVHPFDQEDDALNQVLLVGRNESPCLGVCESSPEKERVVARAYEECANGTEYLEDVEYDADEADGDARRADHGSEDSSGSVVRGEDAVLSLEPAVLPETQLYYGGGACEVGSAGSGPLEQTEYKSEGGVEPDGDKDTAEGDAHGGGHASDPEAYLQKWSGKPGELEGSCGISAGLRSDDGSRERVSELSSTRDKRSGFRYCLSHAEAEDCHHSDSELPRGQACGDAHSIPEHSVNLSWMGTEAPADGNRLVATVALSGTRGKPVSWRGKGLTAGVGALKKSWGRGSSEQGDNRPKRSLLVRGTYETEGESSEWGLGRASPTSDSVLIPKRVAELKDMGGGGFGIVQGWLSSESSRKDGGVGEIPSSGSAVSQFYSGTPNTGELTPEQIECGVGKTLQASDLVGREKGPTTWVDEWIRRLEPEVDSLEGSTLEWPSPKNELLRKRSMSVGAGMDTMAGLSRSHPGSDGPAGPPVLDGDLEVAAALVRSMEVGAIAAVFPGRGLKVVPGFCQFVNLKSIDLSKNSIVRIPPSCLPKSLQHLDLSHNKLTAVDGLRDLSRLRSLKLNSNRIARIGHGLSGCSALRELHLSDNKISEVEGLHRLLKLALLDMSFNKITTTKAVGQLAANYSSMHTINLTGNPVVANLGEDHFRRFMLGLVPHLGVLNKQPIKGAVASRDVASSAKEHTHKTHTKSSSRSAAAGVARSVPGHKRASSGSGGGSTRSHKHGHGGGGGHGVTSPAQLAALEAAAGAVSETSHRRHSHQHRSHHHTSGEDKARSHHHSSGEERTRSHHHSSGGEEKTRAHRLIWAPSGLPPPPPPPPSKAAAAVSIGAQDFGEKA